MNERMRFLLMQKSSVYVYSCMCLEANLLYTNAQPRKYPVVCFARLCEPAKIFDVPAAARTAFTGQIAHQNRKSHIKNNLVRIFVPLAAAKST